jgi:hypothetical protein
MRTAFARTSSAAALLCLSLAVVPAAEAQLPTPPQIVHRAGAAVDNAVAHVKHDVAPRRHHRVRHVRYVRHVRHGHVYYTRVVYYR